MEGSQHLYVGALFLSPFDEKMRLRKAKVAAEATQLEDVRRMQAVPCLLSTVPCLIHICSLATGDGKIVFPVESGAFGAPETQLLPPLISYLAMSHSGLLSFTGTLGQERHLFIEHLRCSPLCGTLGDALRCIVGLRF